MSWPLHHRPYSLHPRTLQVRFALVTCDPRRSKAGSVARSAGNISQLVYDDEWDASITARTGFQFPGDSSQWTEWEPVQQLYNSLSIASMKPRFSQFFTVPPRNFTILKVQEQGFRLTLRRYPVRKPSRLQVILTGLCGYLSYFRNDP